MFFNLDSSCYDGFKLQPGSAPVDAKIEGKIETDEEGCARLCKLRYEGCLSYDYSPNEKLCNVNKVREPSNEKYKDYKFCSKGEEIFFYYSSFNLLLNSFPFF